MRATEAAYAEIEAQEASDVESPGYEAQYDEWKSRSQKRVHEIDYKEAGRRKVSDSIDSFSHLLTWS